MESLMVCDGMTILNTYDPSTGRPYSLEVESGTKTCEEAQKYLAAASVALEGVPLKSNGCYPITRT